VIQLTISKKLYGFGLLGLMFTIATGIAGAWGITRVAEGIDNVGKMGSVIRNHIQASVFLDWSRTDVSKMLTTTGDSQNSAAAELANHLQLFQQRLGSAQSFAEDADIRATLGKESDLASQYVSSATKISDLRAKPSDAMSMIAQFLSGYQDLRNMMDATNDQLQSRSKQDEARANSVVVRSRGTIVVFCVASSVLLLVIAFATARQINRRLGNIVGNLKHLADGDLTHQTLDDRRDELGEMAHWFNHSLEKLRGTIQHVGSSARSMAAAVEQLNDVSQQMSATSEETSSQASIVASTTDQVTQNLQSVASSTEEMSSSAKQIAQSVARAAEVAGVAVKMAENTNQTVGKLGDSSAEIGNMVKVIMSIARQTNLLALNATIEAARAGDAGKGFAVVANEVKELANQTGRATEEISRKIQAVQVRTAESAEAIGKIGEIIVQINEIARNISAAIEEQNVTTTGIARNISEGARGSEEIAANISGVAQAARSASAGARNVQRAAEELRGMSSGLNGLVCQFKYADSNGAVSGAAGNGSSGKPFAEDPSREQYSIATS
jgi:methyl-accepting chemotaxis protein